MRKKDEDSKTFVVFFDLQKSFVRSASYSEIAKYAKNDFGVIAREFGTEDDALAYIRCFMSSQRSYATEGEDTRRCWLCPQYSGSVRLAEYEKSSVKYILFCARNGIRQTAYECASRAVAVEQAVKLLDNNELDATPEENGSGYWRGIASDGSTMVLELRLVIDDGERKQYLNVDPYICLSDKQKALFAGAHDNPWPKAWSWAFLIKYVVIAGLGFLLSVLKVPGFTGRYDGLWCVAVPAICAIIETLRKM